MASDLTSMNIDDNDVIVFVIADFAPRLPEYTDRMRSYCDELDRHKPKYDVMLLQGVKPEAESFVRTVFSECSWHTSPNITRDGFFNMTGVNKEFTMWERSEIAMIGDPDGDGPITKEVEFAPDCLVDLFEFNGNKVRVYNYEALKGPLFEIQRSFCTGLITRDAYRYLQKSKDDDVMVYLGGDLHADSDFESVRLLTGKMTKHGTYPSAFIDVWPALHRNSPDKGYTERETDVFDSTVKLPRLIQPHRHTYFMVYGDAFGRVGTPLSCEISGNSITRSGIPYSDDYGLDMEVWLPESRGFITDEKRRGLFF